jgi:hypothetical protein
MQSACLRSRTDHSLPNPKNNMTSNRLTSKHMRQATTALIAITLAVACSTTVHADPTTILFVGNSYTFGRVNPVMSYNAANVHDLTQSMWATNSTGSNAFEPHPWGGIAGIFKMFTTQAGLDYDVSLSTRNAASLRGHFLNTNTVGWDLRGNIASQKWDKVVLQEQSDEALPKQPGLASNPDYFKNYVDKIEDFIHSGTADSYRERDFFPGATTADKTNACVAATGATATTCNTLRTIGANANSNALADIYLYQTWARPNLINAPFTTAANPVTGAISFTTTPAPSFYASLEAMTTDLRTAFSQAADLADNDGTPGIKAIAPVGEAFLRAVTDGIATRDMYAPNALSDGLLDLWFDDGTHASKWGSYLSALTLFGTITGLDPASLGADETAAQDLGINQRDALSLQRIASLQLGYGTVPEPGTVTLVICGGLLLLWQARRRVRGQPGGVGASGLQSAVSI